MVETILQSDLVIYTILPFLLVFTVVFAILQKTGILGEKKRQIDAIVALVVALIVIAYARATDLIVNLIPIMAVGIVIILVFLILLGTVNKDAGNLPGWLKVAFGIISALAVLISVLYFTGVWSVIVDSLASGNISSFWTNVIFIVIIIAAIAVVVGFGKEK